MGTRLTYPLTSNPLADGNKTGPQPDLDGAFAAMDREQAGAFIVLEEPIIAAHRGRIAELAIARRLPTDFAREQIDARGSLLLRYEPTKSLSGGPNAQRKILNGNRAGRPANSDFCPSTNLW